MKKRTSKLPTPDELAFYRSKIETGSFIGKRQLAAFFSALDAETERADKAESTLHDLAMAAKAHLEMFEVVSEGIPWGKTVLSGEAFARMNEAPLVLRRVLSSLDQK